MISLWHMHGALSRPLISRAIGATLRTPFCYCPFTSSSTSTSPSSPQPKARELYKDQDATWVDRHCPPKWRPYAKLTRIDRPIGTWLLLYPGWWSIALAAPQGAFPDPFLLGLFGVGAFVMRSAGCTINDIWDRDFDAKVERTQNRPIASGQIPLNNAVLFLGAQLGVGLMILTQLNMFSIALGAVSVVPVVGYPLAKRFFGWPQLVLGLTINWGALLGWAAVHGSLDYPVVLPLYASGVLWTLVYDTIYAHQDKEDDAKLGLYSTALTLGDQKTKRALAGFAVGSVGCLGCAGLNAGLGPLFYVGLAASSAHLWWQISTADLSNRLNLTNRFVSNKYVGLLVFLGIVGGKFS